MTKVELSGFDELIALLEESPDALTDAVEQKAAALADEVTGAARLGAPSSSGRLRNSIQSFVEREGDTIRGGARTDYLPAIYHEFGTGPVGDAHPHPKDGELGITRRPDGWVYWSDEAADNRAPGENGERNGFVYTRGVPAKAFLYNSITACEEHIVKELGATVEEVFNK